MTKEAQIQALREIAENTGTDFDMHYGGRGMYGRKCPAIRCDNDGYIAELAEAAGIEHPSHDKMGMRYIVYWTGIDTTDMEDTD